MTNFIRTKHGYSEHDHGYSGSFSWFPSTYFGKWMVVGHGQFTKTGFAVTDDFGTLVEVAV